MDDLKIWIFNVQFGTHIVFGRKYYLDQVQLVGGQLIQITGN